jgi:hypothetical protein
VTAQNFAKSDGLTFPEYVEADRGWYRKEAINEGNKGAVSSVRRSLAMMMHLARAV